MTDEPAPAEAPRPAAPIRITHSIALDPSEISESFVRAGGPGGQHVNTTSSAVQLRFDVRHSPSLPDDVRSRLQRPAGPTLTRAGGPGGQHVNPTSSAGQLRFDVRHSPSLPDDVRSRLERLAGHRLTRDG